MAELDKNRNRLIALLGNCAKVLSSRKDATDETMSLVLKIRKLEKYLRNNIDSLDTVMTVYTHNEDLLSALDSFRQRNVPLSKKMLKKVDNIIQEGERTLEKESSVSFNSIEYLFRQKVKTEKDIADVEREIKIFESQNKAESIEAIKLTRKLKILKLNLKELDDKINKKELQQDEVKELNKKISPLTSAFDIITAKPKAHAFKNEMCFPLTKTKCELKKHPNSKFECFFNDFNRTKTSLFLPFPSKLIQDNLVCVLELQE